MGCVVAAAACSPGAVLHALMPTSANISVKHSQADLLVISAFPSLAMELTDIMTRLAGDGKRLSLGFDKTCQSSAEAKRRRPPNSCHWHELGGRILSGRFGGRWSSKNLLFLVLVAGKAG